MTTQQLQISLKQHGEAMSQCQKKGDYNEAEKYRLKIQQFRKDLRTRLIFEMQMQHKRQNNETTNQYEEQIKYFQTFWDKEIKDLEQKNQQSRQDMLLKHQKEDKNMREKLDLQLPKKVKESSQCLNLRKMEEHMAKQKNYVEAAKVQQRIKNMCLVENEQWNNSRNIKIQTALNKLHAKQASQLTTLDKRFKTSSDQQQKSRLIEQNRLQQKYANRCKQLKSKHQKEVLNLKNQKLSSDQSPNKKKSNTGMNSFV